MFLEESNNIWEKTTILLMEEASLSANFQNSIFLPFL